MTRKVSEGLQQMWRERDYLKLNIKKHKVKIKLLAESYKRVENDEKLMNIGKVAIEIIQFEIILDTLEDAIKIREEDDL